MNTESKAPHSDIAQNGWIERFVPATVRPYLHLMRLDRPIGTWLLLLPCWWSVAMASADPLGGQALVLYALFAVGAVVMRGAGCVVNDIADRNIDGKVARTATRPIPSGAVSVKQAFIFLAMLLALGLLVLVQFNLFTIVLGISSLALVAVYPFMKRITYWPQAVLGLTFNWGALMGWAAVYGGLSAAPGWLYLSGLFWTLGYDTIYAHQDKDDDAMIGVKSTALKFGAQTRPVLAMFYGLTLVLLALAGSAAGLGTVFFVGLLAAGAHLMWQLLSVDIDNAANCLARFRSNRDFGLLVFAAMLADFALA